MNKEIFEPLRDMKRARVSGDTKQFLKASERYLDEMEVDKGIPDQPFDDVQALILKTFFNRMELSEIAEYAMCRMVNLVAYAHVLGVSSNDKNYTAEDLESVDSLIRSGQSPTQVFGVLGIDVPKESLTISQEQRDKLRVMADKLRYVDEDSQGVLL